MRFIYDLSVGESLGGHALALSLFRCFCSGVVFSCFLVLGCFQYTKDLPRDRTVNLLKQQLILISSETRASYLDC